MEKMNYVTLGTNLKETIFLSGEKIAQSEIQEDRKGSRDDFLTDFRTWV